MSQGGSVIAFDLAGGWDAAFRFLDALALIDISNNLGDAKSLATHPASTTHQKIGADARATCLGSATASCASRSGWRRRKDLRADLEQALAAAGGLSRPRSGDLLWRSARRGFRLLAMSRLASLNRRDAH